MRLISSLLAAGAASAALLLCGGAAAASDKTAVSPNGRWRAAVDNAGADADPTSGPASVLRIEPVGGGLGRVLIRGQETAPQNPKGAFHSFEHPVWSLDGGFVYLDVSAWATSPAVHRVSVKTGAERFIIDGGVQGVIRAGPYRGMLLVGRHKYHPAPQFGSYDPVDVVRPDGKVILTVPGSETDEGEPSVAHWLKVHGWTAN
ncbi:hypothetical protein BH09PSE2_BH09PSE2_21800 [soil metagenome]